MSDDFSDSDLRAASAVGIACGLIGGMLLSAVLALVWLYL